MRVIRVLTETYPPYIKDRVFKLTKYAYSFMCFIPNRKFYFTISKNINRFYGNIELKRNIIANTTK